MRFQQLYDVEDFKHGDLVYYMSFLMKKIVELIKVLLKQ